MLTISTIILLLILKDRCAHAQQDVPIKFWNLKSLNGLVGAEADYRAQNMSYRYSYNDKLESSFLTGKLLLNTESYFYHPNLVLLETNMQYNPGTRKNIYLVIPDRSDISTGESARGSIRFLKALPINLSMFTNYNHIFTNRENTTDLESTTFAYGANLNYRNKILSMSASFKSEKIDQDELRTDRKYQTDRKKFRLFSNFNLTEWDENRASFNFDNYEHVYSSQNKIKSSIATYSLNSRVNLDTSYYNSSSTNIYYSQNRGTFDYERFQFNESIFYNPIYNVNTIGNYQYHNTSRKDLSSKQQNFNTRIEHQLYESLKTYLLFEHVNNMQTFSKEFYSTYSAGISYRKKIPFGVLKASYNFSNRDLTRNNYDNKFTVFNEEVVLSDNEIVLLANPYVDINSVVIKNLTETIVYRENIDYVLVARNNFLEVERLPGGLIASGKTVYVDYIAEAQPSYSYALQINRFNVRLTLFENILEIYYRKLNNDFSDITSIYTNIFKTISQNVVGANINYEFISFGFEYDDYNSNIIPLKSYTYYLRVSKRISKKFSGSASGRLKYMELLQEKQWQKFHDFNGQLNYSITTNTNFNINASYRYQKGRGLDLDLRIIRAEVNTNFRYLYFVIGAEGYTRTFSDEKIDYLGGFFKIQRRF